VRKARRAAAWRGRRLRIMFTDEARFGRMNRIRPCWAPIGTRPAVAAQLIREYIYLYGSGETVGNADCRNGRHRLSSIRLPLQMARPFSAQYRQIALCTNRGNVAGKAGLNCRASMLA
jgi:hypothetical protein